MKEPDIVEIDFTAMEEPDVVEVDYGAMESEPDVVEVDDGVTQQHPGTMQEDRVPLDDLSEGELAQLESIVRETPAEEPSWLSKPDPSIHREPVDPDDFQQVHIRDTVEPRTVKNAWLEFTQGSLPEKPRVQEGDEVTDGVIRRDDEIVGELPPEETLTKPAHLLEGAAYAAAIPAGSLALTSGLRTLGAKGASEAAARFLTPLLATSPAWELGSMLTGGVLDLSRLGYGVTKAGLKSAFRGAQSLVDAGSAQRRILAGLEKSLDDVPVRDDDLIGTGDLAKVSRTADDLARQADALDTDEYLTGMRSLEKELPEYRFSEDTAPRKPITRHIHPDLEPEYIRQRDSFPPPDELDARIGGEQVPLDEPAMRAHTGHAATRHSFPTIDELNNIDDVTTYAKGKLTRAGHALEEQVLDWEAPVKRAFNRQGTKGKAVTWDFELSHGADAEAIRQYEADGADAFFRDLSHSDKKFMSEMMESLSTEERASRDLADAVTLNRDGEGVTSRGVLTDVADRVLEESSFNSRVSHNPKLQEKARHLLNRYDGFLSRQWQELADNHMVPVEPETGVQIPREEFVRMDPEELIRTFDPAEKYQFGSRTEEICESGMKMPTSAELAQMRAHPERLLQDIYRRTQGRIFRNRANQSALELARSQDPDMQAVVREFKPSGETRYGLSHDPHPGFVRIPVYENGELTYLLMKEDIARPWVLADPIVNQRVASAVHTWSGSRTVKATATGYNPVFAVKNLARDINHSLMRVHEYSNFIPKALGQLAVDMKETAKDAWKHSGSYVDFYKQGGGQTGMFHGESSQPVLKVLGKLGDFTEHWVRLAVRNRALKNGKSAVEATHIGRGTIDFAQGGGAVKYADKTIPYLNAAIQASRSLGKSFMENPAEFTWKLAQFYILKEGSELLLGGKGLEGVSEYDRKSGIIIPLGIEYRDKSGRKRESYMKIPVDQFQAAAGAVFHDVWESVSHGRMPDLDEIGSAVAEVFPIVQGTNFVPPVASVAFALYNYDTYFHDNIWRGQDVEAWAESYESTPEIWNVAGEAGLSPVRTRAATHSVLVESNPLVSLSVQFTSALAGGMKGQEDTLAPMLEEAFPGVIRSTGSSTRDLYDEHDEVRRKHNTKTHVKYRAYNTRMKRYKNNPSRENYRAVKESVYDLPFEDRKHRLRELSDARQGKSRNPSYWDYIGSTYGEERADMLWKRIQRSSGSEKKRLEQEARSRGYFSDPEFRRRFYELKGQ